MNTVKKTILLLACLVPFLPLKAQAQADTTFVFRFTAGKDMFYVPYNGNDKEQAERERITTEEQTGREAEAKVKPYTLSLRANLLRWATLTPDLGLEWRISR